MSGYQFGIGNRLESIKRAITQASGTRRERIATAVLAGIVASERSADDSPRQMAADAVVLADALIDELDK